MRSTLLAILAALALMFATAPGAYAHSPCTDTGAPGASEFGLLHVSSHTPHGPPGDFHNPGAHMGYSLCLGVH